MGKVCAECRRLEKLQPSPDLSVYKDFGLTSSHMIDSIKQMADAFKAYTVGFPDHPLREGNFVYQDHPTPTMPEVEIRTPRIADEHGCWRLSYFASPPEVANRTEQVEILIDRDMEWVLQTAHSLLLNRLVSAVEPAYLDWVSTPY